LIYAGDNFQILMLVHSRLPQAESACYHFFSNFRIFLKAYQMFTY
jgi:hypothetical protein